MKGLWDRTWWVEGMGIRWPWATARGRVGVRVEAGCGFVCTANPASLELRRCLHTGASCEWMNARDNMMLTLQVRKFILDRVIEAPDRFQVGGPSRVCTCLTHDVGLWHIHNCCAHRSR